MHIVIKNYTKIGEKMKNNNTLDNIDPEIIKQLQQDGRKSYRQIAKELNLSVGTITNRINKLKNTGIIKCFELKIDYAALGYNIETMIGLETKGELENIINKYSDNIIATHKTTGEYDTLLFTRFKDTVELNIFLKKINEEEKVNKTYTRLIWDTMNN